MFWSRSDDDDEDLVDASDLASDIEERIALCEKHVGYIESALHEASRYARRLHGKKITQELHDEGRSYLDMADGYMSNFDYANEGALDLRRAADAALNDHYG